MRFCILPSLICCLALCEDFCAAGELPIRDVSLSKSGTLHGLVTTPHGTARSNAIVQIRHQGRTIAMARSNPEGRFAVSQLRNGLHEVSVDRQVVPIRIWGTALAPPGAGSELVVCCAAALPVISATQSVPQPDSGARRNGVPDSALPVIPAAQCVPQPASGIHRNGVPNSAPSNSIQAFDVMTVATVGSAAAALIIAMETNDRYGQLRSSGNAGVSGFGGAASAGDSSGSGAPASP